MWIYRRDNGLVQIAPKLIILAPKDSRGKTECPASEPYEGSEAETIKQKHILLSQKFQSPILSKLIIQNITNKVGIKSWDFNYNFSSIHILRTRTALYKQTKSYMLEINLYMFRLHVLIDIYRLCDPNMN